MLFGIGCDSVFAFSGRIVDVTGAPIADAMVSLRCDGNEQLTAQTDATGRFQGSMIGWRPNTCVIEIANNGHPPVTLALGDHCAEPHRANTCLGVQLDLVMP